MNDAFSQAPTNCSIHFAPIVVLYIRPNVCASRESDKRSVTARMSVEYLR